CGPRSGDFADPDPVIMQHGDGTSGHRDIVYLVFLLTPDAVDGRRRRAAQLAHDAACDGIADRAVLNGIEALPGLDFLLPITARGDHPPGTADADPVNIGNLT